MLFHPHQPRADQTKVGNMRGSGRRQVSGFVQRPVGTPGHRGPDRLGAKGPSGGRPRTAAAAPRDRAGGRGLCSWEGGREGRGWLRGAEGQSPPRPSLKQLRPKPLPVENVNQKTPPTCTPTLNSGTDERLPRTLTAHPGQQTDADTASSRGRRPCALPGPGGLRARDAWAGDSRTTPSRWLRREMVSPAARPL